MSDADAVKEREKVKEAISQGKAPTGQPADVMQEKNYPGVEEAAQHGGIPGAKGTAGQEKYYKK